ncbi:MAG: ATP-dependent sacrificial sulfur transferase LarE [Gemmatimonadales bacterium]
MQSLRALIRTYPSVLLGYSGGVDSAFLAVVLRQELGKDRMLAAIGRSASYPEAQWRAALDVAARFDIPLLEIHTHELEDPQYVANPTNRCFYCKTELWSKLVPLARERGLAVVCDGTNADDVHEHRPGKAAGVNAGIRSPLAEVGLTKSEIRAASRELGLPTWDAPAAPCLSSRVQYGLSITPSRLKQVEASEAYLRELGITGDLRVRHLGDMARVEVEPSWIPWIEARRATITQYLATLGFARVDVDPRGYRRGSLLERSSP